MKIGVITWFRGKNYGTILQALALQIFLKKNNYDSELIDFEVQEKVEYKKISISTKIIAKIKRTLNKIDDLFHYKEIRKKDEMFYNIINENCTISPKAYNNAEYIKQCNKYDVIICGSDQIWNPNWYNPYYFVNFREVNTKLISYAPSIGVDTINIHKEEISNALNRFSSLSVREESGKDALTKISNKNIEVVLDPTFLLKKDEWNEFANEKLNLTKKPYVLCYMLTDNRNHWKAIRKFVKSIHLDLVVIPYEFFSHFQSKNILRSADVSDFLSLIKNAQFIITDSFHAMVFSIIYEKNFYIFERHNPNNNSSQNSRIYNLLNNFKLNKHLIPYNSCEIAFNEDIDYKKISHYINMRIEHSKEYILNSLNLGGLNGKI